MSDVAAFFSGMSGGIAKDADRKKEMEEKVALERMLQDEQLRRQLAVEDRRSENFLREREGMADLESRMFPDALKRKENLLRSELDIRDDFAQQAEVREAQKLQAKIAAQLAEIDRMERGGEITPKMAQQARQEVRLLAEGLPPSLFREPPSAQQMLTQNSVPYGDGLVVFQPDGKMNFFRTTKNASGGEGGEEGGLTLKPTEFVRLYDNAVKMLTTKDPVTGEETPPKPGDVDAYLDGVFASYQKRFGGPQGAPRPGSDFSGLVGGPLTQFLASVAGASVSEPGADSDSIVVSTSDGKRKVLSKRKLQAWVRYVAEQYPDLDKAPEERRRQVAAALTLLGVQ